MKNNGLRQVNLSSRLLLGFLFIYHGLVPKILWLSATEIHLVELSGIGISATIISPLAGILEILLGFGIIFCRKQNLIIYAAASALFGLLAYVVVMAPNYLNAAFNPVTTNVLGMGLCYLILLTQAHDNNLTPIVEE